VRGCNGHCQDWREPSGKPGFQTKSGEIVFMFDSSIRLLRLIALAILAFATSGPVLAGSVDTSALRNGQTYDRFLVRFHSDTPEKNNAAARQQALDDAGRATGVGIAHLRRMAVGADVIKSDRKLDRAAAARLMQQLARNPHVDYVEIDALARISFTPNDPSYGSQWGYSSAIAGINLPWAWDQSTGSGVVVAVIDTGITPHSDLSANVLPGYDFISDSWKAGDGNGRDANPNDEGDWSPADQCYFGSPPRNSSWHGTHVAGTLAAVTNNAKGVAGVAYGAKVVPLRVLGHCGGYMSDVDDAIVWAVGGTVSGVPNNPNPAEVINLSLGAPGACPITDQTAIDFAVARGAVVVVAAMNEDTDASNLSPASCDNVVTVAATDSTGARAGFSDYGPKVDLAGPGVGVLSTLNTGTTTQGAETYTAYDGTSMATPHVAGTVALMQSVHANSPAIVESILKGSATPLPIACPQGCGAGIVNAAQAVQEALTGPFLSIADVSVAEGDSGTRTATFTVKLSRASDAAVSYSIQTSTGSATAGVDYIARPSTADSIPAGQTSRTFTVDINGDTATELDETFVIYVTNIVGAAVGDAVAVGTILNDDGSTLSISDASVAEGNTGTSVAAFTVSLSAPSPTPVSFDVATGNGSAAAGTDYVAYSATGLVIPAGQTSLTVNVTLNGDTTLEDNETFQVSVSNVGNAVVADGSATGTILNDDAPGLSVGNLYLSEGNSGTKEAVFFVTLSGPTTVPVTYDIATGTANALAIATPGVDYTANTLVGETFAPGQTVKTFSVMVNGDTTVEPTEIYAVNVSNVVGATVLAGQGSGGINNDDFPTMTMADISFSEGDSGSKIVTFTLNLSDPAPGLVQFFADTWDGTATAGSDYAAYHTTGGYISPGQTSKTIGITIYGDTVKEGDESFDLSLNAISGAIMTDRTATAVIVNDDYAPALSIGDVSISEGNAGTKLATFTVSLSKTSSVPVSFDIATADITATAGSDYVASSLVGQTIAAGTTSKTVTVVINGDTAVESDERFFVNVGNVVGATVSDGQAVGTIQNDDANLSIADVMLLEGNSGTRQATFTVSLSQAIPAPVTFDIATADGTATAGSDYLASSLVGQTIAAGTTSKTFSVTLNGDTSIEDQETFLVNVSNVAGATVLRGQAVGTIYNDDQPSLSISDASLSEGNSGSQLATFTVSLSAASLWPVSFDIATANNSALAGSDYLAGSRAGLSIPAGATSLTFTVSINGDTSVEPNETYFVNVSNVSGATVLDGQGVGTIVNDDQPALSISDASITEGNSGNKSLAFTLTLSQASASAVTFNVATADGTAIGGGVDYGSNSWTPATIAAGEVSKTFNVAINGDLAVEGDETFFVNISNVAGAVVADAQGIGTILNDDLPNLSIGDVSISEGNSGTKLASFTVTLAQASPAATTFDIATANGTATAGSDYVASSLAGQVIAAGQTSKSFSVTINGDATIEPNETFLVNLSNVVGANVIDTQAVGTILDDDAPVLTIADVSVAEGNSGKGNVATFTVRLSKAATTAVGFSIATADGSAVAGSDYIASSLTGQSIAAGATSKTFAVTMKPDRLFEPNETFLVNVSNVSGAVTVADGQAIGTILNDD
jgi:subtilisin family serine protease